MYFTLPAQRGSHIQPPPTSSPAAAVLGEIILTLWLQKITQKISGMHQPGTSSPSQAHICWQATTLCCRMVSRVTCNATCHMDHCSVAPFCKDAHRQDLQEAGIVSALSVVISAQVCISNSFYLFFIFSSACWSLEETSCFLIIGIWATCILFSVTQCVWLLTSWKSQTFLLAKPIIFCNLAAWASLSSENGFSRIEFYTTIFSFP